MTEQPPNYSGPTPEPAPTPMYSAPTPAPAPAPMYAAPVGPPPKAFVVTWLLSLFLGTWGIDRFYLGKVGTGILKLVTFGGFGIWGLIDLILIVTGSMTDKLGRPLDGYEANKKVAIIVTAIMLGLSALYSIFAVVIPLLAAGAS